MYIVILLTADKLAMRENERNEKKIIFIFLVTKEFRTEKSRLISGLFQVFKLVMSWEKIADKCPVDVSWFLVASEYVLVSG